MARSWRPSAPPNYRKKCRCCIPYWVSDKQSKKVEKIMHNKFKALTLAVSSTAVFSLAGPAAAQISGDVIKIGFITDMSSVYSDIDGPGGAEAIKMAIADMGGNIKGKKIELLVADHQNKADIAS